MGLLDLEWISLEHRKLSPLSTAIRIGLPIGLSFAFFSATFLLVPPRSAWILGGLMIAYMVPPAGKESVIPLGIALGIPWWLMAAAVVVLDVTTCLFMSLNLDLAMRLPFLGPWISRFLSGGKAFMAERPWLTRWNMLGVAFFVFLPLQGTGGVGATLVGRMVGLTPGRLLLAVGAGATVEALTFALGSDFIWGLITTNLVQGLTVLLFVLLAALAIYLASRWRKKAQEQK